MKWILLSSALFIMQAEAMSKSCAPTPPPSCLRKEEEPECEPDLFKRYDQIFSGSAEFLYWGVAEGGLDYALKMRHEAWGPSPSYAQGKFKNATYQFDPGFRLTLVYFRAPHYWESKWQYTRMTNRGVNNSSKPDSSQKFLTGTWPQVTTEPLSGANSHIHLNYNVFDWTVSRVFFPNPHLRLRLLGGGITAWMNQDWKIRYNDSIPNYTTIRNQWNFAGAGLKLGTMFDWYWTGDLYFTGQTCFGVLMGSYSNQSKQTTTVQTTPGDNPEIPIRNTLYKDVRSTLTGQMFVGPSYQKNFPKNRLEIFAGFEMNVWMNLQEIYRSSSGTPSEEKQTWINSSMLALYGLTTRVTVDF
jgi:hypothetical protein